MDQGVTMLQEAFTRMDLWAHSRDTDCREAIANILGETDLLRFIKSIRVPFLEGTLPQKQLKQFVYLIILYVDRETRNKPTA